MTRVVEPEYLDELPPAAKEARRSRSDLVRINSIMGHARLIAQALRHSCVRRVIDLGAGDGTLLARALDDDFPEVEQVILVDRQTTASENALAVFRRCGIKVTIVQSDVFHWLKLTDSQEKTAIIANLFLHHFEPEPLKELLRLAAGRCVLFVACEPRRGTWPGFAASLLGLIGCNHITRHDARVSVRAGFSGHELTALWPDGSEWRIEEREAGLFSHSFVVRRKQ
jgi:SAM-dependent methyltransferase